MPDVRLPYEFGASLRTDRLVLRTMTDDDVDDIHAYQSRVDVCRYFPFEPRTRDEVAEKVAKYSTALALNVTATSGSSPSSARPSLVA
jgi:RimJ/RimL family protein N-acetyltransferase